MEHVDNDPAVSRRRFLRSAVVAGGAAIALPLVGQEPANCSTRATGAGAASGGAVTTGVSEADLKAVTDAILCEGKCGKTVYTGELTDACPIATKMKNEAAAYLAQGLTPEQTLGRFVADFGEDVLAAPKKSGLDLIPWLLPLMGLGAGAVTVAAATSNWRRAQPAAAPVVPPTDPTLLSRIDEEVEEGL